MTRWFPNQQLFAAAAVIELIFGLFLLSGMGFVYLGQRAVGWTVLLLRVFAIVGGALAVGNVNQMLGLTAGLVLWALLPVSLAFIVAGSGRQPRPASGHAGLAEASLEGLGFFGFSGVGWIASGRWDMGFPILLARFLTLGAGSVYLGIVYLVTLDGSFYGLGRSAALELGLILWFVFLLALWLAFPVASSLLLRRAQRLAVARQQDGSA